MDAKHCEKLKSCKEPYASLFPERVLRVGWVRKGFGRDYWEFCRIEARRESGQLRLEKHWRAMLDRCHRQRVLDNRLRELRNRPKKKQLPTAAQIERARVVEEKRAARRVKRLKDLEQHLADMELNRRRKEARKIKNEFCAQWEKDYGHLFRRSVKAEKKRNRILREARAKAKRDPRVWKIRRQIQNNPHNCYWCGVFIEEGAEVDHVVPLKAGGDDGGCNLVPSCQNCNRVKQGGLPNGKELKVSPQLEICLTT